MNNGQIAFYTAVATAIPVVVVIYVVGARQDIARASTTFNELLQTRVAPYSRRLRSALAKRFAASELPGPFHALAGYITLLAVFLVWSFFVVALLAVIGGLLCLLVAPLIGEYFALHALSSNRASTAATTWATVGLVATAVYLFAPVLFALRAPIATMGRLILGLLIIMLSLPLRMWADIARLFRRQRRSHL